MADWQRRAAGRRGFAGGSGSFGDRGGRAIALGGAIREGADAWSWRNAMRRPARRRVIGAGESRFGGSLGTSERRAQVALPALRRISSSIRSGVRGARSVRSDPCSSCAR
jgi:hypothetical protein